MMRECVSTKKSGFDVVIISEGESGKENGIDFIGFPHTSFRLMRFFVRSKKMIVEAIKQEPDIVQLHAPELLLYALRLKRLGIKVIFDSHEFYSYQIREKHYIPKPIRNAVASVYSMFETFVCRRIDCVLYPCTVLGKNYFANKAKKSLKIENYSMSVAPYPKLFINNAIQNHAVIHAGGLTEERGITTLAQAIIKTDAILILCGPFSSPGYQQKVMDLCPQGKIEYKGNLDRASLFQQYAQVAVGVCTIHAVGQYALLDNMSTKVYEYMQSGLPVVMSDFPCYRHWNSIYHFGICVDPENVDEIADAIRYLFDHPDEARQMGENGRRAVEEEFNWDVEAKKLLRLYEEILNDN